MVARKRKPNESWEKYKKNLRLEAILLKSKERGVLVWDSKNMGTLVKRANTITRHKNEVEAYERLKKYSGRV